MKRKLQIIILSLLISFSGNLLAQQVISSAGASATGTNVQLSWNIGEPVIETFTGTSAILTQGLLQSKLEVTAVDPLDYPGLTLMVYPNPVFSSLRLDLQGELPKNLYLRLFDLNGKQILIRQIETLPELINMENFAQGTYLLKVSGNLDEPLKTFKIIKN
jgi:hypothetical protein